MSELLTNIRSCFARNWTVVDTRTGRVVYRFRYMGQAVRCARNSNGLDLTHFEARHTP